MVVVPARPSAYVRGGEDRIVVGITKANRLLKSANHAYEEATGFLGAVDDALDVADYTLALDYLDTAISELMTLRSYLEALRTSL